MWLLVELTGSRSIYNCGIIIALLVWIWEPILYDKKVFQEFTQVGENVVPNIKEVISNNACDRTIMAVARQRSFL